MSGWAGMVGWVDGGWGDLPPRISKRTAAMVPTMVVKKVPMANPLTQRVSDTESNPDPDPEPDHYCSLVIRVHSHTIYDSS